VNVLLAPGKRYLILTRRPNIILLILPPAWHFFHHSSESIELLTPCKNQTLVSSVHKRCSPDGDAHQYSIAEVLIVGLPSRGTFWEPEGFFLRSEQEMTWTLGRLGIHWRSNKIYLCHKCFVFIVSFAICHSSFSDFYGSLLYAYFHVLTFI
jgi:hypothetical protein